MNGLTLCSMFIRTSLSRTLKDLSMQLDLRGLLTSYLLEHFARFSGQELEQDPKCLG